MLEIKGKKPSKPHAADGLESEVGDVNVFGR